MVGDLLTIDNLVQALAHLAEAALGQVVTFYILLYIRLLGRASANVFFRLAICWFLEKNGRNVHKFIILVTEDMFFLTPSLLCDYDEKPKHYEDDRTTDVVLR